MIYWPADSVPLDLVRDETRLLERVELLEDAGPTRAQVGGQRIRGHRTTLANVDEDGAPQR